ncbi:MAG TPA: alpha/beta hydrolase [Candidatus Eisenbacteria bacterium]|nr:alpha/beta hydrolase [Candidatus Eisenbacteria bacterium]
MKLHGSVRGTGSDVVFLHAGIADRRMWAPQAPVFERTFRVTTYDLRGFGESPMVPGPYAHTRDLVALLDEKGVKRAALVGASMGGSVAIDFTLEHPDRVTALVLVDAGLDGYRFQDPWLKERWAASEGALERGDWEEAARIEIATWLAGPDRRIEEVPQSLRDLLREMLLASYPATKAGGIEEGPDTSSIERLGEIRVPALVLLGEHDVPDMRRIAGILASDIPKAEHAVIANAAHLPSLERPEEFNRLALEFLERALR